ncbi:MAG: Cys-tRNA(Pro) deacylase [Pseudomonadales bacterium]|nr:Cys-tRNA(Pro) deacylase [Pseudomonadales bacterium]
MTPAITLLKKQKITCTIHEYQHDPQTPSYGLEAAEKLGIEPDRFFKTLIATLNTGDLVVAILPVTSQLNLKALAKLAGAKKAEMADTQKAQSTTGYLVGGISPIGQKRRLATYLDRSAEQSSTIFVSAGKRGLEVELSPSDLINVTQAQTGLLQQV